MSAAIVRRLPVVRPQGKLRRHVRARPAAVNERPLSNLRIAVVMLLVAETMFFAGFIGAYLVFRYGTLNWPPRDLPRLPLAVTWANTLVLLASAYSMSAALRACQADRAAALARGLAWTAGLGALFVLVQGSEWVRLVHHGLTLQAGTYGATFYTLIGAHALHVLGGLLALAALAVVGRVRGARAEHVEAVAIYWFFVCVLWLVLFALVYR